MAPPPIIGYGVSTASNSAAGLFAESLDGLFIDSFRQLGGSYPGELRGASDGAFTEGGHLLRREDFNLAHPFIAVNGNVFHQVIWGRPGHVTTRGAPFKERAQNVAAVFLGGALG